jgi:hypothetical protein
MNYFYKYVSAKINCHCFSLKWQIDLAKTTAKPKYFLLQKISNVPNLKLPKVIHKLKINLIIRTQKN